MSKVTRSPNTFSVLAASFAFLLFSGLFMGCEKEVEVEVPINYVSVDSVVVLGDVEAGGTVKITAIVTTTEEAGATLTYSWFTTAGSIADAAEDTITLTAPDEESIVTVTVHVTDGTYIGIGSGPVGVGMYAPTASEWYIGAATCSQCHDTEGNYKYTYTPWQGTGHASAFDPSAPSYCAPCHTVGVNGLDDAIDGDAGYDDAPIATYEDVQCENCHGRGSAHQTSLAAADISISYDAAVCGDCHSGTHNPNYDEWSVSGHANLTSGYAKGSSSCQGCHEGVAAGYRLSSDLSTYYDGGAIDRTGGVSGRTAPDNQMLICATCHDPHDATNMHQLRTVDDVQLITANTLSPLITEGGPGKLCMQCHHARHSGEEHVPDGDDHFGPHHSNQADMLTGNSGYEAVAPGFTWAQPNHAGLEETCITCHMHKFEYNTVFTDSAYTGHQFNPRVEACVQCHGEIEAFEDILAFDDYDGDGTVEGMELEVHGLMTILETALIDSFTANGITTTDWDADSLLEVIGIVKHARAPGDTLIAPVPWRAAGYNWVFIHDDGSHGFHNPDYAVQLLQQSFKHLTGSLPAGAAPLIGNGRIATR